MYWSFARLEILPSRKSANALPVAEPLNWYWPRMLTPMPKPSIAVLRFHNAPVRREWPPITKVVLLLIENELWSTVRSTLRLASTMFTGRFEPVNAKPGKP